MNIIFIAPPAAGKGTQASLLKEEFGLYHLSTGDLLREIAATNTEIGKEIKNLIDNGLFVSDELMLRLLESKISSIKKSNGIIFDGFPRTLKQASMLDELMEKNNDKIDHVIFLDIEKEVATKRATGRVSCNNCGSIYNIYFDSFIEDGKCNKCGCALTKREDDTIEKFSNRFDTYMEKTMPLISYYENKGLLTKIKSSLVSNQTLCELSKKLELGDFILLGHGEEASGGRQRENMLEDLFEAIVGAIYLDAGIVEAKNFIIKTYKEKLNDLNISNSYKDYKSIFQEIIQKEYKINPKYLTKEIENDMFKSEVIVNNKSYAAGSGKSKKDAEMEAAKNALIYIKRL